jgi:predicted nucleotidyltransferase
MPAMKTDPLTAHELALIEEVFSRHPEVSDVTLFGSRAKGTHAPNSDIDLSVRGEISALQTEALASELDELPLPYRFDVLAFDQLNSKPLREHIERVGIVIYPACHA